MPIFTGYIRTRKQYSVGVPGRLALLIFRFGNAHLVQQEADSILKKVVNHRLPFLTLLFLFQVPPPAET